MFVHSEECSLLSCVAKKRIKRILGYEYNKFKKQKNQRNVALQALIEMRIATINHVGEVKVTEDIETNEIKQTGLNTVTKMDIFFRF